VKDTEGATADAGRDDDRPRHPIQVAARRSGVFTDTLRAWERRYRAVTPSRHRGRRLYSDADVARLVLLREAVEGGRRIGDIAGLPDAELRALVEEDRRGGTPRPREAGAPESRDGAPVDHLFERVARLDATGLERALVEARAARPLPSLLDEVVGPLLERVGEAWRDGRLGIAHEHLVSAALRSVLSRDIESGLVASTAPVVVITTPAGHLHELGAVMAAAAAAAAGWRPLYLGPNLPAAEIARSAEGAGAEAVALSAVHPVGDPLLVDEIARLRQLLPGRVALLVGGRAARADADRLVAAGARVVPDQRALVAALSRLAP